jgi:hypothetical protein
MAQETPGEPETPRYERHGRHEKEEKEEEKHGEKDEKSRNEKTRDEKWRRDPVGPISWASAFIWAGLCMLADTTSWGPNTFSWWDTWAVILAGVGAIFIFFGLVRLAMPEYRRPVAGNLIFGAILLAVGLQGLTTWSWGVLAAILLIFIGLIIVFGGVFRRRA